MKTTPLVANMTCGWVMFVVTGTTSQNASIESCLFFGIICSQHAAAIRFDMQAQGFKVMSGNGSPILGNSERVIAQTDLKYISSCSPLLNPSQPSKSSCLSATNETITGSHGISDFTVNCSLGRF